MELKDIIIGCKKNDRKAQEALYKMFYKSIYRTCMNYERESNRAAELLQDGFVRVFDKIHLYDGTGNFEGWMKRVVVNIFYDKKRKVVKNLETSVDCMGGGTNTVEGGTMNSHHSSRVDSLFYRKSLGDKYYEQPEFEIEEFEISNLNTFTTQQIFDAVSQLTPTYRDVFSMYVIDGLTHREISEVLGISEGTSKSNLFKAKRNLKVMLKDKIELEINYT